MLGAGEEVWELIGVKFVTMRNKVKFGDYKCREKDRKKTLLKQRCHELQNILSTVTRLQKLHQTTFLRPCAGTVVH